MGRLYEIQVPKLESEIAIHAGSLLQILPPKGPRYRYVTMLDTFPNHNDDKK